MTELVTITGGSFLMGENDNDKFANDTERPRHEVHVPSFLLGRSPVTIGEFRSFRPNHESGLPENWPATMVTWEDAMAYCAWVGARLPTEAEWEYAARAGSRSPFPWGDDITPELANYYYNEQGNKVGPGHRTPPGQYPPNAFGIFDMLGNVCEWTADAWYPKYADFPTDGNRADLCPIGASSLSPGQAPAPPWVLGKISSCPVGAASQKPLNLAGCMEPISRVLRGGAWDYLPRLLRVSWRDRLPQHHCRDNVGFRIASNL